MNHYQFFTNSPKLLIHEGDFESTQNAIDQGILIFGSKEQVTDSVAVHNTDSGQAWKISEAGVSQL